MTTSKINDKR